MRHTPDVSEMDDHQATYTTQRRDVMVKRVDEELRLTENKKRARDAANECTEAYKRAKLIQLDPAATGFQHGIASPRAPGLG